MPFTAAAAIGGGASIASVAADLAIVGAGVSAVGQYQAGKQQEAIYDYNAKVQANQARQEEYAAKSDADLLAERGRKLRARQRVQYAGAGVGLAGTPLMVFEQTASDVSQDTAMAIWGGKQRAGYYRSQAGLSLMYGRSAKRAGMFGAGSTLLSGASSALSMYMTSRGSRQSSKGGKK